MFDDGTGECALPCAWCTRDAYGVSLTATLIRKATHFTSNGVSAFEQRKNSCECGTVTRARSIEKFLGAQIAATHLRDLHNLGDAIDSIAHNALDSGLQSLIGRRTRGARTRQRDRDNARCLIDLAQDDVSTIGLQCWPNDLNCLFDLLTH
jgi:hypothetical protein